MLDAGTQGLTTAYHNNRQRRVNRVFLAEAGRFLKEIAGKPDKTWNHGRVAHNVVFHRPLLRVTLKLPPRTVELLRKYARSSGLTIGAIVTGALNAFLRALKRHG